MTPLAYYHEQCSQELISADQAQLVIMQQLEIISLQLIREQKKRQHFLSLLRKKKLVQGLYVWGGVGIGKTFMMDCFYHCLPFREKKRMHFHQFMHHIHQQLRALQGQQNPLKIIAKNISKDTIVLCFDEFFVKDITDAMLLAGLLKALFSEGVSLVTTSNVAPDELYKKGLQRPQFLPAIALLKQHTTVMHIASIVDYRLQYLKNAGVFYTPNDAFAQQKMTSTFEALTHAADVNTNPLMINDRVIPIIKSAGSVIWFQFDKICSVPRSQQDYLAIAEEYNTVFISDVARIRANDRNKIILFIHMIDVFYDARIKLVLSSEVEVIDIYQEGPLAFEYQRAASRLLEMQSEKYFATEK